MTLDAGAALGVSVVSATAIRDGTDALAPVVPDTRPAKGDPMTTETTYRFDVLAGGEERGRELLVHGEQSGDDSLARGDQQGADLLAGEPRDYDVLAGGEFRAHDELMAAR